MNNILKSLWGKYLIEGILTLLLWLVYYTAKYLLPKSWRMSDTTLRKIADDIAAISSNLPNKTDDLGEIAKKSNNIFTQFRKDQARGSNLLELKKIINQFGDNVDYKTDHTFTSMVLPSIEAFAIKRRTIKEFGTNQTVAELTFSLNETLVNVYVFRNANDTLGTTVSYEQTFAITQGQNPFELLNLLFPKLHNRMFLTVHNDTLRIEKLALEENQRDYILPEAMFNEITTEIQKFKTQKIQRSYIIYGPPGTGKTSLCLAIAKELTGKIVKLDSKVFTELGTLQSKSIVQGLFCDVIIVDDIDRIVFSDLAAFFHMLESIKDYSNQPTLLATVNDPSKLDNAVLRPGRFDDLFEMPLPTKIDRELFLSAMLQKLNIDCSPSDLQILVEETKGMTQVYLKEYCRQLSIGESIPKIIKKIQKRRKFLPSPKIHDSIDESMDLFATPTKESEQENDQDN